MASSDPTGGEQAVPLSISPAQAQYLRRELLGLMAGLKEDAQSHPDRPEARRWVAEAEAYRHLVAGLEVGEIVPDDRVRRLVREWAEAHDLSEHYERVVFEHDAIAALSAQIGANR